MDGYLRQSTASQSRLIGPFVDDTDFKTAETALTINNTDIKLRANGTTLSNKNSGGATHQANGTYSVTWDATDTANVGELKYVVLVSGALLVWGSYTVLEEAVYDALFAASAVGPMLTTSTGTNLTAIPWNASWDAEVQSEVQDAIEANNLDHLLKLAVDTSLSNTVHLDSVIGYMLDQGTSWTYDRTTDSLEAFVAAGGSPPSADTIAQTLLKYDLSTITGEASRSPINAMRFLRNKWSISGTTLTVTEEDDVTTAWTAALTTQTAAQNVIGVDP